MDSLLCDQNALILCRRCSLANAEVCRETYNIADTEYSSDCDGQSHDIAAVEDSAKQ